MKVRTARRIFSLSVILIGIGMALGQDCRVTTPVRFVNEHAEPVSNITADQLKAEIGGKPAKILAITPRKPEIILLIDGSSSNNGTWGEIVTSAKQIAADAPTGIAAVVFRDKILAVANGRSDTEKLLDQLPSVTPSRGGTALYETLVDVAGKTKGNDDAALVVIGDGEDNMSRYSSDQVASMFLRSSWPPVFGLILDYDHQETRRGYFHKIAVETGGLTFVPPNASKVAASATTLRDDVFASFRVTLIPSKAITKAMKLKIEVVGPNHGIHVAHAAAVSTCDSVLSGPEKPVNP